MASPLTSHRALTRCLQQACRAHRRPHSSAHRAFTTRTPHHQATPSTSPTPSTSTAKSPTTAERPPPTARSTAQQPAPPIQDILKTGLADAPPSSAATTPADTHAVDWTTSFHGLSATAFAPDVAAILLAPLDAADIEVKPDGIVYLPEIKYRRILNRAFGPGGWGLAPRGETIVTGKSVTREYALLAHGRLISIARGEQDYFEPDGIPTATEGCKSNALMRCCKDLGVASELWDPRFIRGFMREHARELWVEHVVSKKKRKITLRKDDEPRYPYAASKA